MKPKLIREFNFTAIAWLAILPVSAQMLTEVSLAANQGTIIPIEKLGAVASKQYQGDGLSIIPTPDGARLRCAFQRLEGLATHEGLWLSSTADNSSGERFRVMAVAVGRTPDFGFGNLGSRQELSGLVNVTGDVARFIRPGLTEEYSVSVVGVRQDFIIEQRPAGGGELRVVLDVTDAKAEPLVNGARLVLNGSRRKLAFNRLNVTDVRGRELSARLEVTDANRLVVVVNDADAIYPVRIDPTFSDADWSSLGGIPSVNSLVNAMVVDGSGNLYIGGFFTTAGGISANRVAKWDGNAWSPLGSGMNDRVYALAVSGTNLYAGGWFTTAGGVTANRVAKWDGNAWLALGLGMNDAVYALAVSGTNLYAGGSFTKADDGGAYQVAKWDGSTWSALGSGMPLNVDAVVTLAVSDTNLFAGGVFVLPYISLHTNVAKWNGSAWSALAAGLNDVGALAVVGTNLYAGGITGGRIGKWDGSAWSALGAGVNGTIWAMAASGTNLYVGGDFTTAGGTPAKRIAKWDGNTWSPLGSGMNNSVYALAMSGWSLYAGGNFTTAGDKAVTYTAAAYIGPARGRFGDMVYSEATGFSCTFLDASVGQPYRIQASPSLAVGSWTDFTNFTYTAPIIITDATAGSGTNKFFRAVTP